jgi:hypothetical protein
MFSIRLLCFQFAPFRSLKPITWSGSQLCTVLTTVWNSSGCAVRQAARHRSVITELLFLCEIRGGWSYATGGLCRVPSVLLCHCSFYHCSMLIFSPDQRAPTLYLYQHMHINYTKSQHIHTHEAFYMLRVQRSIAVLRQPSIQRDI